MSKAITFFPLPLLRIPVCRRPNIFHNIINFLTIQKSSKYVEGREKEYTFLVGQLLEHRMLVQSADLERREGRWPMGGWVGADQKGMKIDKQEQENTMFSVLLYTYAQCSHFVCRHTFIISPKLAKFHTFGLTKQPSTTTTSNRQEEGKQGSQVRPPFMD